MRRAFANGLEQLADADDRVVFLTGDLGFQVFDAFVAKHGRRYVNVGIAEAQMVAAAAGLALEGFRPFVYSIASFMTARPFEQFRFCVAYPKLPVIAVGAGGGYTYGPSGVSHHAPDDLALMSLLPNMTVVAPGDPHEVSALLPQLLQLDSPSYMRIGKFGEPPLDVPAPVVLGKARLLRTGERVAILTTGNMAAHALDACRHLAAAQIHPSVYHFHTVKPLDTTTLDHLARSVEALLIVEESSPMGGLGAEVLKYIRGADSGPRVLRLGPPDAFALGSYRQETLQQRWGYDAPAIDRACRCLWNNTQTTLGSS
jgi:transketolase